MARDVTIRYVGDSSSAERASRRVQDANQRMGRDFARVSTGVNTRFGSMGVTFRRFGQAAAIGLAGAGVLAVKMGLDFVKAAEESQKVTRQTNAVIESTGGVARITADHVARLSEEMSNKAGIDDELIQSGQNVLLTFTNIRNEVGKGNDIFDQAAQVALDMSTALGTDLQTSVIQVGKALQDPIKGIGNLRRVGVNFSTDQVEMIKKLVETGDTLGAQKIILQELTTEFGGSAEAQATSSGKLRVAWDNLQETLGQKLLPVVDAFSTWLREEGIPLVESFAGWIEDVAIPAVKDFGGWVRDNVLPPLGTMGDVLTDVLIPALESAASWINDRVVPAFDTLNDMLGKNNEELKDQGPNWTGWVAALGVAAGGIALLAAAVAPLGATLKIVAGIFGFVATSAQVAFLLILRILPFAHIISAVFLFRDQIVGAFAWIRDRIVSNWNGAWTIVKSIMSQWWASLTTWLSNLKLSISRTWEGVKATASAAWTSVKDRVKAQWESIKLNVKTAATSVKNTLSNIWDSIKKKASDIWSGIKTGLKNIWNDIKDAVRGGVNGVIRVINSLIGGLNRVLDILPGLGGTTIPKIRELSAGRGAGGGRGRKAGGTVPPFVTDGPRAIVGEGNRAFPEYVIPTDPKYRGRALSLLGEAGSKLMASGGKVPSYQLGGIIDDIPGAGIVKGIAGGIVEFARKGAAIAIFGPLNKVASKLIDQIPWKFVRQLAHGVRQWFYDWVKGQDDKLPTDGGGGARGRGPGIAGLYEPLASIVSKVIAAAQGAVSVISGWRSRAQQERLYAKYLAGTGNLAAKPGTSKHERGLAVDYGGNQATYQRLHRRYGGHFPVRGEPWHGEVPGFQRGGIIDASSLSRLQFKRLYAAGWRGHPLDRREALYSPRRQESFKPIRTWQVSSAIWKNLLGQGWRGIPWDRMEALYPPGYHALLGRFFAAVSKQRQLRGYQHGGVVPTDGPIYAHRGEEVIPAGRSRPTQIFHVTINVQGGDPQATVEALKRYVRSQGPVPITVRG